MKKIIKQVEEFLKKEEVGDLINSLKFQDLYRLASRSLHYMNIGKMTDIFYEAGLDPLKYMDSVPNNFRSYSDASEVHVPSNVDFVGDKAFQCMNNLTDLKIDEGPTSLGEEAFFLCEKLSHIDLPNSLTTIQSHCFKSCMSLVDVELPKQVQFIGMSSFANCKNLQKFKCSQRLLQLPTRCFNGCDQLEEVQLNEFLTVIDEGVFYDCNKLTDLNYAGTIRDWYKIVKDSQWLKYSSVKVVHCSDGDIKVQ